MHDANLGWDPTVTAAQGRQRGQHRTGPHRAPKPKKGQREILKAAHEKKAPSLVPLRHGNPYCEGCRDQLKPGMLVGWWSVPRGRGGVRKTVFCAPCHRGQIKALSR